MSSRHLFSVVKMSGVRAFQQQKRVCASWNWFCLSKRRVGNRTVGTLKLSDLCPSIPPFPFSPRRAGVQSAPWPYWAGKRRHHAGIMLWVLLGSNQTLSANTFSIRISWFSLVIFHRWAVAPDGFFVFFVPYFFGTYARYNRHASFQSSDQRHNQPLCT